MIQVRDGDNAYRGRSTIYPLFRGCRSTLYPSKSYQSLPITRCQWANSQLQPWGRRRRRADGVLRLDTSVNQLRSVFGQTEPCCWSGECNIFLLPSNLKADNAVVLRLLPLHHLRLPRDIKTTQRRAHCGSQPSRRPSPHRHTAESTSGCGLGEGAAWDWDSGGYYHYSPGVLLSFPSSLVYGDLTAFGTGRSYRICAWAAEVGVHRRGVE